MKANSIAWQTCQKESQELSQVRIWFINFLSENKSFYDLLSKHLNSFSKHQIPYHQYQNVPDSKLCPSALKAEPFQNIEGRQFSFSRFPKMTFSLKALYHYRALK